MKAALLILFICCYLGLNAQRKQVPVTMDIITLDYTLKRPVETKVDTIRPYQIVNKTTANLDNVIARTVCVYIVYDDTNNNVPVSDISMHYYLGLNRWGYYDR